MEQYEIDVLGKIIAEIAQKQSQHGTAGPTMDVELKPCRLCGGEAFIKHRRETSSGPMLFGWCRECWEQGRECATEAEAIAAWNRRPDDGR